MSKWAVRVVRKRSLGSYRPAAEAVNGAAPHRPRRRSRLPSVRTVDILEEREVGDRGEPDAVDVGLKDRHVGLVPQADHWNIARDGRLRLAVEQPPLLVVGHRRRLL